MPTEHSSIVFLYGTSDKTVDKTESFVLDWIEPEVNKLYPHTQSTERFIITGSHLNLYKRIN